MPYNGSGSFSPPASSFPFVAGTLVEAAKVDSVVSDVATGLSTAICKDGQTTVTGNIPFNGFKLTNVGTPSARSDATNVGAIQDGIGTFVSSVGGSANAITLAPNPAIAAYTTGQCFRFIVATTNTGAVTVSISALTTKAITLRGSTALIAGDLIAGSLAEITYDGVEFVLTTGGAASPFVGSTLTNVNLVTSTVGGDPTVALGVASKQYVDALWTTGDIKITLKTVADSGWVLFNDGTIGNASSGATTRANADTNALFSLLWTNTTDANCAVSGGRGASASDDFAANKTIALPKVLGRALAVAGSGSGLSARALAAALGSEDAINVSHTHGVTDPGHAHVEQTGTQASGSNSDVTRLTTGQAPSTITLASSTASATTGLTVNSAGSSGTGANMQPTSFFNIMVKL